MSDDNPAYRAFLIGVGVVGLAAAVAGGAGVYTVLTGGTVDDQPTDEFGGFLCESFDGDPAVAHEPAYGVDRTLVSPDEITGIEATTDPAGVAFDVSGGVLDASARAPDGAEIAVETGETRVVVRAETPFRVWIDSVTEDATVTRTRLDVCPPGN